MDFGSYRDCEIGWGGLQVVPEVPEESEKRDEVAEAEGLDQTDVLSDLSPLLSNVSFQPPGPTSSMWNSCRGATGLGLELPAMTNVQHLVRLGLRGLLWNMYLKRLSIRQIVPLRLQ